jgi:hypothetical protein
MALHRFVLIACLVGLALPACKQDEDEACQVNTDCADGLVCSIARSALRGVCLPPDQLPEDSGTPNEDGGDTVPDDARIPDPSGDDDASTDDDVG